MLHVKRALLYLSAWRSFSTFRANVENIFKIAPTRGPLPLLYCPGTLSKNSRIRQAVKAFLSFLSGYFLVRKTPGKLRSTVLHHSTRAAVTDSRQNVDMADTLARIKMLKV